MAKFKCKHSGCEYEWFEEEIIKGMREHTEYEEVSPTAPSPPKTSTKKEKV